MLCKTGQSVILFHFCIERELHFLGEGIQTLLKLKAAQRRLRGISPGLKNPFLMGDLRNEDLGSISERT